MLEISLIAVVVAAIVFWITSFFWLKSISNEGKKKVSLEDLLEDVRMRGSAALSDNQALRLVEAAIQFDAVGQYFDMGHIHPQLLEPFWRRFFKVAANPLPSSVENYVNGEPARNKKI